MICTGPELDLPLSLNHSSLERLTCLVDLIYLTVAFENAKSKFVEVVTVADVDTEDNVGNSLLQIWELTFDSKA